MVSKIAVKRLNVPKIGKFELTLVVLAQHRRKLSFAKSFAVDIHTKFHIKHQSNCSDETCE